jgi:hypothetical protein
MPTAERFAIWPDGTCCSMDELEEFLSWKSDDYRVVIVDDVFDLDKQLFDDEDDSRASSRLP